jgi:hypothetical protein
VWRSRSALGLTIPEGIQPEIGNHIFGREALEDGTPLTRRYRASDASCSAGSPPSRSRCCWRSRCCCAGS